MCNVKFTGTDSCHVTMDLLHFGVNFDKFLSSAIMLTVKSEGTDAGPSHASAPLQQSSGAYPSAHPTLLASSGETEQA